VPIYDQIFAKLYDPFFAAAERDGLGQKRKDLLAQASGRVIEIGAGTGLNLEYFPSTLEKVVLSEPSEPMAAKLRDRAAAAPFECEVVIAPAEKLPFDDDSFDTAICTLVLCTVPDPEAALAEISRVLAPGGRLLLLEHVRNADAKSAKWQDRLETPWRLFGNGCYCNRDTEANVKAAGFALDDLDHGTLPHFPPIARPLIVGVGRQPIANGQTSP
jgi:ubiquinone/menaquinone biosynthesis C-methylase UbiE